MSVNLQQDYIKAKLKLYFECRLGVYESIFNVCGRLKGQSELLLGLYHYHNLVESEYGCFEPVDSDGSDDSDDSNCDRDRRAFGIFQLLANCVDTETIETYYPWYMIGQCYLYGSGTFVDRNKAYVWFKKAADKGIPDEHNDKLVDLYFKDEMFDEAIKVAEKAFNSGMSWAANVY